VLLVVSTLTPTHMWRLLWIDGGLLGVESFPATETGFLQTSTGGHLKSWVGSDPINRLTHQHWWGPHNDRRRYERPLVVVGVWGLGLIGRRATRMSV